MLRVLLKRVPIRGYLMNHKATPIDMPISRPPKYIYKIEYHPIAAPTMDGGFEDHEHENPFLEKIMSDFQNSKLRYTGEHWDLGSISGKIVLIGFPLLIYFMMDNTHQDRISKRYPGLDTSENQGSVSQMNVGVAKMI